MKLQGLRDLEKFRLSGRVAEQLERAIQEGVFFLASALRRSGT